MEKEKYIQIIQQVYLDFGNQNIQGVLNALTDDIAWNDPGYPEVPYAKTRTGKNDVMNFFVEMAGTITFTNFIPQEFYYDQETVLVKGFFEGKSNTINKPFKTDWMMIWKFRGDKICSYQAFVDTVKIASSLK